MDRAALIQQIDDATGRLLATAGRLTDEEVRRPSLLPGWTRGHVLTHVARGGDALRNLLVWARTGVETQAYASREARDEAIEAGSGRPAAEHVKDIAGSAEAFRSEVAAMPEDSWEFTLRVPGIPDLPAEEVLLRRLVELELHHADLGAGYLPSGWPSFFKELALPEPMRSQREERLAW
ncbi:maleylpyruvate isomerase N-terminal domain-containing protein [Actinocorallia sp. B10E7]|uniref:maleylpyruvate isomerase N-terminal domain-containing protein n=1 Tax=Actinocorallia sp. B10E7 TaxID=3153558 RepID=UPI00325F770B